MYLAESTWLHIESEHTHRVMWEMGGDRRVCTPVCGVVHGSPKANFAHRGKVDLVCLYVVLLGSLERVEHDCPRKAAAGQFLSHCDSTLGRVVSC